MAELSADHSEVKARLLYWGTEGAGKTANLQHVHRKLRSDNRGELRHVPTALDPSVTYEQLPINLGELAGMQVRLQVSTTPGGREHAPTRKQLLDHVDGIVLVVDSSPERLEANLAAFDELRSSLSAYGRSLNDLALVVQYNKRDRADDFTLEELHRKLDLSDAAVFEAVATEGKGVLQALTTISKGIVRRLRGEFGASPTPAAATPTEPALPDPEPIAEPLVDPHPTPLPEEMAPLEPAAEVAPKDSMLMGLEAEERSPEAAVLAGAAVQEAEALFDSPFDIAPAAPIDDLEIDTIGEPRQTAPRAFAVPMTLRDAGGRTYRMTVRVSLDPGEEPAD
jgi:signal recognition particle receptor subunit beta